MTKYSRILGLIVFLLPLVLGARADCQESSLSFNEEGQFKIVQFTDTHYFLGGKQSPEVIENIEAVLEAEEPDLVVLTGDIVTGSGPGWPTLESWEQLTAHFIERSIPWAVAFGNHDDEADVSRQALLEYLSALPFCLMHDDAGEEVAGTGNYTIPVCNRGGAAEFLLYCMDSRSYSLAKDRGVEGYGWFDPSQIRWFESRNQAWLENNPGIHSLLFFHIPLPEYREAFDEGSFHKGVRKEKECAPDINTGMGAALALQGNVLGTFVGHDHNNNYLTLWHGIALCYGYFSGGNSYGKLPQNGARVILLEEGRAGFSTWLRRRDGKLLHQVEIAP